MYYHSTRSDSITATAAQGILQGLASDGGLFISPLTALDWEDLMDRDTFAMATKILSHLLPDVEHMDRLVEQAYRGKFETEDLTPLVPVGDRFVLELFRGPTSAFKDVALSMLPQLITQAREQTAMSHEILILTATSGDTGKAAMAGFCNVPGTKIIVFYPDQGVSAVQKAQMVTQEGGNVHVCAVRGNFDDAQTGVKNIFSNLRGQELPFALSSANSINIGRLAPQIMYYFRAYRDLMDAGKITLGDQVNFSVPTGNFGDILAGYLAKLLGLPVGKLLCASNANNVLTDFIRTGTYNRLRPLLKTTSPSMDILVSSNLERLLYLMSGDTALVAELMAKLNESGSYTVPEDLLGRIQDQFWAGCCDDVGAKATMAKVFAQTHYLCDPHTAAGWAVAEDYVNQTGDKRPMVVLSTASPYKFPAAVLDAIGGDVSGDEFTLMERLESLSGMPTPRNLATLKGKAERHLDVIPKDKMQEYVLNL